MCVDRMANCFPQGKKAPRQSGKKVQGSLEQPPPGEFTPSAPTTTLPHTSCPPSKLTTTPYSSSLYPKNLLPQVTSIPSLSHSLSRGLLARTKLRPSLPPLDRPFTAPEHASKYAPSSTRPVPWQTLRDSGGGAESGTTASSWGIVFLFPFMKSESASGELKQRIMVVERRRKSHQCSVSANPWLRLSADASRSKSSKAIPRARRLWARTRPLWKKTKFQGLSGSFRWIC